MVSLYRNVTGNQKICFSFLVLLEYIKRIYKGNTMPAQKDSTFLVRLDADLKESFISAAKSQDRTAAQLIRDFMRDYVKKHGQTDLFRK